ncbi:membrane-bound lytic murein transglycosylase MltF [Photobacterium phosphoreum]|uniref:membrane-bound lytic murein transglycosylase MltF n=1 Tax=Photobacterium phosphoreum TaxID=659 RepID=UPI00359418E7
MNIKFFTLLRRFMSILFLAILTTGCQWQENKPTSLEKIRDSGVLRVGTLNNQLSYYIGAEGPTGLDYELAQAFAKKLGVKLEITAMFTLSELFPALERGDIDIIAAGLAVTPDRLQGFHPAPAYYYASQIVVYKKGQRRPRNLAELAENKKRLAVVSGSSQEQKLQLIRENYPTLQWQSIPESDINDLLIKVAKGELDYTVAYSVDVALLQRIHPDIAIALELTQDEPVSWFVKQSSNGSLYALMIEFFGQMKQNGTIDQLEEKYFGHIDQFDYVDTRAFLRAVNTTLPQWEALFKQHANGFDWRLLAALSYQESHWNPQAVSPTGVRGMMMLTLPTAESVGVTNRLDPEQSIRGGSEYLRKMIARVPDSVEEHEKVWFALASYNVGFGHLMDARRLTKAQGGNPDTWVDVKQRLPLLGQRKYYTQSRYGYARGDEALNYVEGIRRYYQSIIGYERAHSNKFENDNLKIVDGLQTISTPQTQPTPTPVPLKKEASLLP